jgi:dipeptidase D
VFIRKPATPGYENRKGIILQSHLDMVPQKNNDKKHDFEKDPIEPFVEGEWVKANGTTLGADNGIGVAAMMAVLEAKDLVHGPLEALFTIDEETGMTGAFALTPEMLKGDILLNLDSEDEGDCMLDVPVVWMPILSFLIRRSRFRQDFFHFQSGSQV